MPVGARISTDYLAMVAMIEESWARATMVYHMVTNFELGTVMES